jgi:hypothetical protein
LFCPSLWEKGFLFLANAAGVLGKNCPKRLSALKNRVSRITNPRQVGSGLQIPNSGLGKNCPEKPRRGEPSVENSSSSNQKLRRSGPIDNKTSGPLLRSFFCGFSVFLQTIRPYGTFADGILRFGQFLPKTHGHVAGDEKPLFASSHFPNPAFSYIILFRRNSV